SSEQFAQIFRVFRVFRAFRVFRILRGRALGRRILAHGRFRRRRRLGRRRRGAAVRHGFIERQRLGRSRSARRGDGCSLDIVVRAFVRGGNAPPGGRTVTSQEGGGACAVGARPSGPARCVLLARGCFTASLPPRPPP